LEGRGEEVREYFKFYGLVHFFGGEGKGRGSKIPISSLLGKREAYISNINDTNNESKKK
jgi:hypothetical protein